MKEYKRKLILVHRVLENNQLKHVVGYTMVTDSQFSAVVPYSYCKTQTNSVVTHTRHGIIRTLVTTSL